MTMWKKTVLSAAAALMASSVVVCATPAAAVSVAPQYRGFEVVGGPAYSTSLADAPHAYRAAVMGSAASGKPAVFDPATGGYVIGGAVAAQAAVVTPDSVTGGFYLPAGTKRSAYRWDQTSVTKLGVVANPDGDIVAEVDIKIVETITGNTSDYWKYSYNLNYRKGGLYRLNVRLTCAVNEKGKPDDYCTSIVYPNGKHDTGVTPSHVTEVHDLATGNTVNNNPTGFFGTHSSPPPSGSTQVIKFAHLTESAYFSDYKITDQALIRGYDVCVPKKASFSKVTLCGSSGDGH
jgi:hypothetical protein